MSNTQFSSQKLYWFRPIFIQNFPKILRISVAKFSGGQRIEMWKFSGFLHPENSGSQPYFKVISVISELAIFCNAQSRVVLNNESAPKATSSTDISATEQFKLLVKQSPKTWNSIQDHGTLGESEGIFSDQGVAPLAATVKNKNYLGSN